MTSTGLDLLVEELDTELRRDRRDPGLTQRLAAYARTHADWRRFALFDPVTYARNLVFKNELFELILLCWQPAQTTPIHNHQGQRCWMAVLDGAVEETQFHAPAGKGAPIRGSVRRFERGAVAFITDDIALHSIAPLGDLPAVSLHLYSRPIPACQVFDPRTGEITLRQLAYHSVRGVRQPDASADA